MRKDRHVRNLHPKVQLAITCAFEHFTALLGGYILRHPEVLSTLDEDAMKLWVWHAIEEIEHRAVAFDVYQEIYGDHKLRTLIMRSVTTGFASLTFTRPANCSCRIDVKAYLKWELIFSGFIWWPKCLCNYCQNIWLITNQIFTLPITITAN